MSQSLLNLTPVLSFSKEKRLTGDIKKTLDTNSRLISRNGSLVDNKLPVTHELKSQLDDNREILERDKDALYTALAVTTSLPDKAGRMSELQIIKDDVQEFSSDVKEYVSTVKASLKKQVVIERRSKKAQDGLREKSHLISRSSNGDSTHWHPVHRWNVDLIDAINAAGPSCATLVKNQ